MDVREWKGKWWKSVNAAEIKMLKQRSEGKKTRKRNKGLKEKDQGGERKREVRGKRVCIEETEREDRKGGRGRREENWKEICRSVSGAVNCVCSNEAQR